MGRPLIRVAGVLVTVVTVAACLAFFLRIASIH